MIYKWIFGELSIYKNHFLSKNAFGEIDTHAKSWNNSDASFVVHAESIVSKNLFAVFLSKIPFCLNILQTWASIISAHI